MKIRITTAAVVAGVSLLAATPVSAGEYAGNGEFVPGGPTGRSACSYSGLDEPDDLESDDMGDDQLWFQGVQNYGQLVRQGLGDAFPGPGDSCRGNGSKGR